MKIKFTCNNCVESFNIETKHLKDKTTIICPNCSSEFPKEQFEKLKQSLVGLDEVTKSLTEFNNYGLPISKWNFEILNT